jgi:hypothetical protein
VFNQIAELQKQMQAVTKEANTQFQRIAQIQMQLDRLMAMLKGSET